MNYLDRIYGNFELSEPVLIKLIQSNAMQRLQGILQHGITGMIGICSMSTRFEHSVGVMRLVQKMGGSLKEQIAALVHDVSHTAFSHVIDHVFKQADTQSFHEERKEWFFQQSDIPDILNQYGYQWQEFLDEDQFGILVSVVLGCIGSCSAQSAIAIVSQNHRFKNKELIDLLRYISSVDGVFALIFFSLALCIFPNQEQVELNANNKL